MKVKNSQLYLTAFSTVAYSSGAARQGTGGEAQNNIGNVNVEGGDCEKGVRTSGHTPTGHSQLVTLIWSQPFGHNHLVTVIWFFRL